VNVNYRYLDDELAYLLDDSDAEVLVFHSSLGDRVGRVRGSLPKLRLLVEVADDDHHLDGAVPFDELLAAHAPEPRQPRSGQDITMLYTGGTTGMPKGVQWRQHDIFRAAMGGRTYGTWELVESYEHLAARVLPTDDIRVMSIPPLMHGAAQWACFYYMAMGATMVFPTNTRSVDAVDVWDTVARERVIGISVVGDAMARPVVEELERGGHDASSLLAFGSGGATLSVGIKERLLAVLPHVMIQDVAGASETGVQMGVASTPGSVSTGTFVAGPGTVVVSADLSRVLDAGDEEVGWLAQRGSVPLGYLGDAEKTARTFPVIDGEHYSVPGDRARTLANGEIELLGRDSVTINSGGEKIFAEEVEQAIIAHPAVADVVVAGRPSERWGQEVVALVQVADGHKVTTEEILDEAGKHVARFKLPKAIAFLPHIVRSPAGKADYRWARERALEA
jgi:fatty-acyl-CoA synthase